MSLPAVLLLAAGLACQSGEKVCTDIARELASKLEKQEGLGRVAVFPALRYSADNMRQDKGEITRIGEFLADEVARLLGPTKCVVGAALERELNRWNRSVALYGGVNDARAMARNASFDWVVAGRVEIKDPEKAQATISIAMSAMPVGEGGRPLHARRKFVLAGDESTRAVMVSLLQLSKGRPSGDFPKTFVTTPERELEVGVRSLAQSVLAAWKEKGISGAVGLLPFLEGPEAGSCKLSEEIHGALAGQAPRFGLKVVPPADLEKTLGARGHSMHGLPTGRVVALFGEELGVDWIAGLELGDLRAGTRCPVKLTVHSTKDREVEHTAVAATIGNELCAKVLASALKSPGKHRFDPWQALAVRFADLTVQVLTKCEDRLEGLRIRARPVETPRSQKLTQQWRDARKEYNTHFNQTVSLGRAQGKQLPAIWALSQGPVTILDKEFGTLRAAFAYVGKLGRIRSRLRQPSALRNAAVRLVRSQKEFAEHILPTTTERDFVDDVVLDDVDDFKRTAAIEEGEIGRRETEAANAALYLRLFEQGRSVYASAEIWNFRSEQLGKVTVALPPKQAERIRAAYLGEPAELPAAGPARPEPAAGRRAGALENLYTRTRSGVVLLYHKTGKGVSLGTGFVFTSKGHVMTNNHVVKDWKTMKARFPDGKEVEATVVTKDPDLDVAVLTLPELPENTHVFRLGRDRDLAVGRPIAILGHSDAHTWSLTSGIISKVKVRDKRGSVMYTAPTLPGSSGSALMLHDGTVVGVHSKGKYVGQGRGGKRIFHIGFVFACPVGKVRAFLKEKGIEVQ